LLFACNLMWLLQLTCIMLKQDQTEPFFTIWAPILIADISLAPFALRYFKPLERKSRGNLIFEQLALPGTFPAKVLMTLGTQLCLKYRH